MKTPEQWAAETITGDGPRDRLIRQIIADAVRLVQAEARAELAPVKFKVRRWVLVKRYFGFNAGEPWREFDGSKMYIVHSGWVRSGDGESNETPDNIVALCAECGAVIRELTPAENAAIDAGGELPQEPPAQPKPPGLDPAKDPIVPGLVFDASKHPNGNLFGTRTILGPHPTEANGWSVAGSQLQTIDWWHEQGIRECTWLRIEPPAAPDEPAPDADQMLEDYITAKKRWLESDDFSAEEAVLYNTMTVKAAEYVAALKHRAAE